MVIAAPAEESGILMQGGLGVGLPDGRHRP